MTDPVETYLQGLFYIKSSGAATEETSYYPILERLLNEVGKQLKPKVMCIMNIASQGAGLPDGGLFTSGQFNKNFKTGVPPPTLPSRGVIEVKGTADNAWETAQGDQVTKYWGKYRQILVTNYRDFVLVAQDKNGKLKRLETFHLAKNETDFWFAATTPNKTAKEIGRRFINYLKRVMLHLAPLADPQDVAQFLASYAHEAKDRLGDLELPALMGLRNALEESLGLKFQGKKGEHFFRSTLVQTLFYGIFSAWVIWGKENDSKSEDFDWRRAAWLVRVPMVRVLFEQIATPSKLGPLHIDEVLDWTADTLNRVDKKAFFAKFEEKHAVQYFYEPFLEAFDPTLRKELGVWYTPPEIVEYMVNRIDKVLKEELSIKEGLADPRVYVLDPAAGTGSYLLEILRVIAGRLKQEGSDALFADDLKRAAMERILGFEILPAPFVIAHLQLGLLLQSLGVQISEDKNERVGVYLTNSLTGWGLPEEPQKTFDFPELEREREESEQVKREKPILVVLGNPPYNAFAGLSPKEEQGLVEPYKEGLRTEWDIKSFNLDELYVRFFRLAERRIAERTGKGIICYISNFSYLSSPEFVVMRKRLLSEFDMFWFDCMNGSSRETGKLTPEGKPDPSVFSTKYNHEGIRVGTAICLMVRKNERQDHPTVRFRNFWGVTKKTDLIKSLKAEKFNENYGLVNPSEKDRYSFAFSHTPNDYYTWPSIPEMAMKHFNGPIERRGNSLISLVPDSKELNVLQDYLNPSVTDDQMRAIAPRLMKSSGDFNAPEARGFLLKKKVRFKPEKIRRYPFKVMDIRLAYLDDEIQPLFSRPRPELLVNQEIENNSYLITRDTADKQPEGSPFYYSTTICDYDCISGHARHIPIWIKVGPAQIGKNNKKKRTNSKGKQSTFSAREHMPTDVSCIANLSESARAYLKALSITDPNNSREAAELIWMHTLAVVFSPAYLTENADGIKLGWPRVPLPRSKQALQLSAQLGAKIAILLDPNVLAVKGVDQDPCLEIKIARITRVGGGNLDPSTGDLCIKEGWGHGKEVVMPGTGKLLQRNYSKEEKNEMIESLKSNAPTEDELLGKLGISTVDIYLNNVAYWENIPLKVWNYTMGGYQILKKWLAYRECDVLGRAITSEEAREFTNIARRIAVILLLESLLDKNYEQIKKDAFVWKF